MKNIRKYCYLLLLLLGFARVSNTGEDYSKMSANKLNEALIIAVKKGFSDEVQQLVQAGANVNQKISYTKPNYDDYDSEITCTLLEYAAKHNYADIVKKFIQVKAKNDDINTALILAAEEGHANVVRELVQAKPIAYLSQLRILLGEIFLAPIKAIKGLYAELKQFSYRADAINIALISAAKNFPGITANPSSGHRHRTALKDYLNVIKELIKVGANVNHTDERGDTALIKVIEESLYTEAQKKDRAEIIQILLKAKADVNHANKEGYTALMRAIQKHDFDAVQILLKAPKININQADNNGNTALIIAVQSIQSTYVSGNKEQYNSCLNSQNIVKALLQTSGINPHHVNKNGDTAIKLLKKKNEAMSCWA